MLTRFVNTPKNIPARITSQYRCQEIRLTARNTYTRVRTSRHSVVLDIKYNFCKEIFAE